MIFKKLCLQHDSVARVYLRQLIGVHFICVHCVLTSVETAESPAAATAVVLIVVVVVVVDGQI